MPQDQCESSNSIATMSSISENACFVTYAMVRQIQTHAGGSRIQQTYNVIADSQDTRKPRSDIKLSDPREKTAARYTCDRGNRAVRKLGKHVRLAAESTVPLYSDQVPSHTLLRYHQRLSTSWQLRFHRLTRPTDEERTKRRKLPDTCRHCSPWRTAEMGGLIRSGGSQETLVGPGSDQDYMWEIKGVPLYYHHKQELPAHTTCVLVRPEENLKFCLLYCVKQPECQHEEMCMFSSRFVRQLNKQLFLPRYEGAASGEGVGYRGAGPAVNLVGKKQLHETDIDLVPCIRWQYWPWSHFQSRHRPGAWPSEDVVTNIVQFGVHLVPVGCGQDSREMHQWRVSTSRAEILLVWTLPPKVRMCLQLLKQVKNNVMKPVGKELNSYIFKQTVFWMCEEEGTMEDASVMDIVFKILEKVKSYVKKKCLKHFFADDVNDFATFSEARLNRLASAVSKAKDNLWSFILDAQVHHMITLVLSCQHLPLTERDVRTCTARNMVVNGLLRSLDELVHDPCTGCVRQFDILNSQLVIDKALGHYSKPASVCSVMFSVCVTEAIAACPGDVAARMPLTKDGAGFLWDLAPLFALLTKGDLKLVLQLNGGLSKLDDFLKQHNNPNFKQRHTNLHPSLWKPLENMTDSERSKFLLDGTLMYGILLSGRETCLSHFWRVINEEKLFDLKSIDETVTSEPPDDPFQLCRGGDAGPVAALQYLASRGLSTRPTERDGRFRTVRRLLVEALVLSLKRLVYDPRRKKVATFASPEGGLDDRLERREFGGARGVQFSVCVTEAVAVCPSDLAARMPLTRDGDGFRWDLTPLFAVLTERDLDMVLQVQGGLSSFNGFLEAHRFKRDQQQHPNLRSGLQKPLTWMTDEERYELLLSDQLLYGILVCYPGQIVSKWQEENEEKLAILNKHRSNMKKLPETGSKHLTGVHHDEHLKSCSQRKRVRREEKELKSRKKWNMRRGN